MNVLRQGGADVNSDSCTRRARLGSLSTRSIDSPGDDMYSFDGLSNSKEDFDEASSVESDAGEGLPMGKTITMRTERTDFTSFTRFACENEDFEDAQADKKPAVATKSDDGCSLQESLVSDVSIATEELLTTVSQAVATAKEVGDDGGVAQALYWQATVLVQNGKYNEAYASAQEAAQIFQLAGDQQGEARSLLACSIADLVAGRRGRALEAADMALCLARLDGDEALERAARSTHGNCLQALESPSLAVIEE